MATGSYTPALNPANTYNSGTVSKGFTTLQGTASVTALLDDREINEGVLDLQNDGAWTTWMSQLGYTSLASKAWFFDTFYNNPKLKVCTVTVTVAPATSGTLSTVTFTSDQAYYLRVGDTILLPSLRTLVVTSVTSGTTVVAATDTGIFSLSTGDKVVSNGRALGEGSAAGTPFRATLSALRNNMQIMDDVYQITDVQGAAKRTVNVGGSFMSVLQAEIDTFQRLQALEAMTFMSGEASATLYGDASPVLTDNGTQGGAIQKTRGLDRYITDNGIQPTVTVAGTITIADSQDMTSRLWGVKAPVDQWMLGSGDAKTVWDIFVKGLNSSAVSPVRIAGDSPNISYECEGWKFGGYNFTVMSSPLLSNPQTFNYVASGTTKNSITRSLYIVPKGNCNVYGGAPTKYFMMRYMNFAEQFVMQNAAAPTGSNLQTNGRLTIFKTGGLAGFGTDANYTARLYSAMGAQVNLSQLMGKWIVK